MSRPSTKAENIEGQWLSPTHKMKKEEIKKIRNNLDLTAAHAKKFLERKIQETFQSVHKPKLPNQYTTALTPNSTAQKSFLHPILERNNSFNFVEKRGRSAVPRELTAPAQSTL